MRGRNARIDRYMRQEADRQTTIDRRTAVRYLNEHIAFTYSLGKSRDVCVGAKVHDISCDGIGLIVNEPLKTGMILNIELHSKLKRVPCFLLARVMWSGERPDGTVMAGCQFSRSLSEQELVELL